MWFQVSGIEDDAEKVRVEAYMLMKITKDLPLHPVLIVLKWDRLSVVTLREISTRESAGRLHKPGS